MKNTKIVKAWDTVTPTAAQKRRMRAALEAQLNAPETPSKSEDADLLDFTLPQPTRLKTGKHPQKPRPKYQAVQPKKKRGSAFALIAAMLAVVVTGGLFLGIMQGKPEENPSQARPVENLTTPTTFATEAPKTTELPQGYQDVISKYVTAIEESWNPEKCMNADISILTANAQSTEDLGYALMDLDGDGEAELLITDGNVIYSLYSLTPAGETLCLITGMERDAYYLSDNGIIANVGSGGAALSYYIFYRFTGDALDVIEQLTFDANTNPVSPWFTGDMEENVTEEQANAIIDAYPHRYISHTTLSGEPPMAEAALPDAETLNLYAQKISGILADYADGETPIYCFLDFDGNGETELLLGVGNAMRTLLIPDGQGGVTANSAMEYGIYCCQDGILEYTGVDQGRTYHQYERVRDGIQLDYFATDGERWYTQDGTAISQAEAQAIRSKYKRLNLPWKNISEFPVTIPESSGEGISTLFDDCFLPIAEEGKLLTQDELENRLAEKGFLGEEGEGLITWTDSEIPEGYLRVPVADASGYVHGPLTYGLPGVVGRYVAVLWDENGNVQYWKEADTYRNTYAVDSPEELTAFLNLSDENLLAMDAAETFAEKYFAGEASKQREEWNKDSENKIHSWDYSYDISEIRGYEDAGAAYETNGYAEITAAAYVDSPDSYTYLTMRLEKENGAWTVTDSWLEK